MSDDFGWTRSEISLAATSFMVVSALMMPVVGRLVDRFDARSVIAVSVVIASVGIGFMAGVQAQWQVFLLYGVVYAIGNAGTSVAPVGVMISGWFVRRRGMATSSAMAGTAAGQLVIIALLAALIASASWRWAYGLLGLVTFVVVLPLVLIAVRKPPEAEADSENEPHAVAKELPSVQAGDALRTRQLWLLFTIYAICGFQDFFVATHVVAFALDQNVRPVIAGNMLAFMGLFGLVGVLATGLMADAFGAARPTLLCFLLRIVLFVGIMLFQNTWSIIAFALLYGFTFIITAPLTFVFVGNIFGRARLGTITGLINMVHQIFGGLGAFVGGLIFDAYGSYDRIFVALLFLAIIAALATLFVRERSVVSAVTFAR